MLIVKRDNISSEVTASNTNSFKNQKEDKSKPTNIMVCVRIRPLS